MLIRKRMKADLTEAIKARQRSKVTALRSVLAAIDNAEAIEAGDRPQPVVGRSNDVPRKELNEDDIRDIVQREIVDYQSSIAQYEQLGKEAEGNQLRERLEIIAHYLVL
jgi:uncharacterized protein YqeY